MWCDVGAVDRAVTLAWEANVYDSASHGSAATTGGGLLKKTPIYGCMDDSCCIALEGALAANLLGGAIACAFILATLLVWLVFSMYVPT